MLSGHQRIKWRKNIAEHFNRLSRVHERYRQTDRETTDRQTDGRRHVANMIYMSSRSLKSTIVKLLNTTYSVARVTSSDVNTIRLRSLSRQ